MLKESQLKSLLKTIVKEVLNELASSTYGAESSDSYSSSSGLDSPTTPKVSPAVQAKMERDKKIAASQDLAATKKTKAQMKDQLAADTKRNQLNRRIRLPAIEKDIRAKEKELSKM